jgi:hypothetical protein
MKKQLIAAAVAASMSAVAVADVAITGNAKFEYDHTDNNGSTSNTSNTEVNLLVKGKTGDTTVVANLELNTHGDTATDHNSSTSGNQTAIDVEDLYMTTKVGDINVKAGNWASGTSALIGEIDNGARSNNKIDLSTSFGDVKVYAGNNGASQSNGDSTLNNNMYGGVTLNNVMGNTINFKKNSEVQDSFGIKGAVGGVSYRVESSDHDTEGDTTFVELAGSLGGLKVNVASLNADTANALDEDDSSLFALSTGHSDNATATGQDQVWISTNMEGTTVDLKMGSIEKGISTTKDRDYTQVKATRKLASGATAVITFTDQDMSSGSKENLEIELNVAF